MRPHLLVLFFLAACVRPNPPPKKTQPPQTQPTSATTQKTTPTTTPTPPTPTSTASQPSEPPPAPSKPKPEEIPAGQVLGSLNTTRSYCGGARPPDELLRELATPKPAPGMKLLFRKGETNSTSAKVTVEVETDKDGNFIASKLAAGTYCIVEEWKRKYKLPKWNNLTADKGCYANWLKECDATLTLGKAHGEYLEIMLPLGCGDPVCVPIPPRP